ncbi:MAG: hypothetical protein JSU63_17910 [Phycisphaerales bacterium]|nr:MAG: hypothetical protein JSU63_17910 [Phycisphaerales bacterium]
MFATPEWLGATGFYDDDLRTPLDRNECKTWAPICVWATVLYYPETMPVTFQASTSAVPPADRRYLLELLSVPGGVSGAPAEGTVWELPLEDQLTLELPTYRTSDGLTGYQFAFTITEAEPGPGDVDNDGDVDPEDYALFGRCFTGPIGEIDPRCEAQHFARADVNEDGRVDLVDFSLFAVNYTGLLASRPTYIGTAGCVECHEANHYDWADTRHATAFQTLIDDEEEDNPTCYPCHTTGYGSAGGFVAPDTTPDLINVQCEVCHGPGSHHAADSENVGISVDLDSAMCGQCHVSCHGLCGDYYHPHYEQWSTSKHSQALADIWWDDDYDQSCLQCHSTDYRLAPEDDKPSTLEVKYSLECVACHDPHGGINVSQLRLQPESLCGQCHTMGDAMPGVEPDRPHYEFMHATGGFALDGTSLDGLYSTPFTALRGECVFCHVYREPYVEPDQPANSGHTFESNTRACTVCHTLEEAEGRIASVQSEIEPRLATIARYFDESDPLYLDPATLSSGELEQYWIAKFDYDLVNADASFGVHQAPFARRLLAEAEALFGIVPP